MNVKQLRKAIENTHYRIIYIRSKEMSIVWTNNEYCAKEYILVIGASVLAMGLENIEQRLRRTKVI